LLTNDWKSEYSKREDDNSVGFSVELNSDRDPGSAAFLTDAMPMTTISWDETVKPAARTVADYWGPPFSTLSFVIRGRQASVVAPDPALYLAAADRNTMNVGLQNQVRLRNSCVARLAAIYDSLC
jgi:hypothetical protein